MFFSQIKFYSFKTITYNCFEYSLLIVINMAISNGPTGDEKKKQNK